MRISDVGVTSPWGEIQHSHEIGDGMFIVSTASHGGLILEGDLLRRMIRERFNRRFGVSPATLYWDCPNHLQSWGHWEEDCDLPLALYLLDDLVNDDEMKAGWRTSASFNKIVDYTVGRYKKEIG